MGQSEVPDWILVHFNHKSLVGGLGGDAQFWGCLVVPDLSLLICEVGPASLGLREAAGPQPICL